MPSQIRIVLADSCPIVLHGLHAVLKRNPLLEIVGETLNGLDALDLLDKHQPDLFITETVMPSLSGLEVVRQARQRSAQIRCLFFTSHDADQYIHEAFRSGASGYLLKTASPEQIRQAVRQIAAGKRYVSSDLSERIVHAYLNNINQFMVTDAYDELTTREREILQMVAEGATNIVIGDRLFISARTVEIHRANVMRKLSLKSQTDLIRYCIKRGIISL